EPHPTRKNPRPNGRGFLVLTVLSIHSPVDSQSCRFAVPVATRGDPASTRRQLEGSGRVGSAGGSEMLSQSLQRGLETRRLLDPLGEPLGAATIKTDREQHTGRLHAEAETGAVVGNRDHLGSYRREPGTPANLRDRQGELRRSLRGEEGHVAPGGTDRHPVLG